MAITKLNKRNLKPAVASSTDSKKSDAQRTSDLSKKINKAGTMKAFKKLGLDYDSYCR